MTPSTMELTSGNSPEKEVMEMKRKQKWVFLVIGLLAALVAALAVALIVVLSNNNSEATETRHTSAGGQALPSNQNVCTTPACVQSAASIISSMNPDADPCVDMHEYACGGWIAKNPIPEDRTTYTVFSKLQKELDAQLRGLLEELPAKLKNGLGGLPSKVREVSDLYQACLNESSIEDLGEQPLIDTISTIGGWPMMGQAWTTSSSFNVTELITQLRLLQHGVYLTSSVDQDLKDSDTHIISIDQPRLGMGSRDFFLDPKHKKFKDAYRKVMTDVALLFGGEESTVTADVDAVLELETSVANLTVPPEQRRDYQALYKKVTIRELAVQAPQIDWLYYLQTLLQVVGKTIDVNDTVVVYSWDYLAEVSVFLQTADERTVQNYAVWRFVFNFLEDLSEPARNLLLEYKKVAFGTQSDIPRWETCVKTASNAMGTVMGRLFVDKYFDETAKESALQMISDIRTTFTEHLPDLDWMDKQTELKAKAKADFMDERIGYSNRLKNNTLVDQKFEGVFYENDQHFANMIEYTKYLFRYKFKDYQEPVDNEKWATQPAVINAYYNFLRNAITFPAGILQPPFYGKDRPKYLNYGGIGMVIGHEIVHGFDDVGRQFNKFGDLAEWWDEDVVEKYKNRTQCIVDQYSSYIVDQVGLKVNGILTQGENIADSGGIKYAHKAYERYVSRNGPEDLLPGINHTQEQLFFLSFSQIWCDSARDAALIQRINTAAHSPKKFRILGTLHNTPAFSKAFGCKPGQPMNPTKRCTVW